MAHLFRRTLVMPDHLSDAMDHMHDKGRHRISARPWIRTFESGLDRCQNTTPVFDCVKRGGVAHASASACLRRNGPPAWKRRHRTSAGLVVTTCQRMT